MTGPQMTGPHRFPTPLAVVSGLLMGSADAVPGVSGGTIALIIGIYDQFIAALSTVVRTPFLLATREKRSQLGRALAFLFPLGAGLAVAYYLVTKLLVGPTDAPGILLRQQTGPICYGFFFGLVIASIREPWKFISNHSPYLYAVASLGAAASFIFVGLPHQTTTSASWLLLLGGAGAIAVMLLPGVSGSLFLVIIGQYTVVTSAVHDRNLTILAVFLGGIVVGVITVVPALRYCLRRYKDVTMAMLAGLMAGSLRALWPWKIGYNPKLGPTTNVGIGDSIPYVSLAVIAGALVVLLLARLQQRIIASQKPEKASLAK